MFTIATRESPLALWQAEFVKRQLEGQGHVVKLLGMTTEGDRTPRIENNGKLLFVKELEEALLDGRADLAVHSIKDMPTTLPPGLMLAAITEREDPRDTFVSSRYANLHDLPSGAKVGTASLRRRAQLASMRSDLTLLPLHGNVGTRLARALSGEFDAVVLAAAGLKRLGQEQNIRHYFEIDDMVPAPGQGAIGIECRQENENILRVLQALDHLPTRHCVLAERAVSHVLGGSCQVPVGAYAHIVGNEMYVHGFVGKEDGSQVLRAKSVGPVVQAEKIGSQVAKDLLAQGAEEILRRYVK